MMDLVCLWVGRLVLIACGLIVLTGAYWGLFKKIRECVDAGGHFWHFYAREIRKQRDNKHGGAG